MCPLFKLHVAGIEFIIPAYGLFACIGLFCIMLFLYNRIDLLKISFKKFLLLILFMGIGVGIGSKFLFILTKIPDIIANFSIGYLLKTIITSGFVFYGGLFGAILGVCVYSKVFKLNVSKTLNMIVPAFPMFHAFGRLGCFFAGCCYGKVASWGFSLESEPGVLRIPIQLIESGCILLILLVLLLVEKRFNGTKKLLPIYLGLYAIIRFILEFYRGDKIRGIWAGLSTSQWVSILIIVGIIVWKCKTLYYERKVTKDERI